MSWRGTFALLIIALTALGYFLYSNFVDTPPDDGPLLGLDPSQADSIQIQESGAGFSLIKTNGLWNIRGDLNDRADPRFVRALLETAADITPLDILRPHDLRGAVTLSALNLKKPIRTIAFHAGRSHTLWLGVEGPAQGQIYSRLDGGKSVYLIDGKIADMAFHPVQEYRDPRLTALSTDHLEQATLTKGTELQQLRLKKGVHGWEIQSPVSTAGEDKAVTAWLDTWLSARITAWMPEGTDPSACGMDSPTAVVTLLESGETNPLTITIGASVPDAPGSYYVRCSDRPGICTIADLSNSLAVTPLTLRSRTLKPVEYDTVDRIEIINGGMTNSLTRKPESDDWQSHDKGQVDVIPSHVLKDWFDQIQGLSATSFESATPEHLTQRGLGEPDTSPASTVPLRIRFIAQLTENTAQENAGEVVLADYAFGPVTNNEVALHEGDATDLMILPASAFDMVKNAPLSTTAHK